jgi:hypothetical protein
LTHRSGGTKAQMEKGGEKGKFEDRGSRDAVGGGILRLGKTDSEFLTLWAAPPKGDQGDKEEPAHGQGQALAEAASGTQAWFTDVRCAGTSGNFPDAQLPDPGFLLVLDFQYESRQWTPASACSLVRDTLLGALNSGALSFLRRLLPVSFCLCASL